MLTDVLRSPSVQRLAAILQSRYGTGLEVRFMVDASTGSWQGAQPSLSGTDLYIPITAEETFLGLAKVSGVAELSPPVLSAICDVVRLVLEPALYERYLEQVEFQQRARILSSESRPQPVHGLEEGNGHQDVKAVLLHSRNPHKVYNMAVTLHEQTGRWAFLRYSDINRDFNKLEEMGRATLLVQDLLEIDPHQWGLLKSFLLRSRPSEHPIILLGTSRTWLEWRSSGEIDHDILDLVAPYTAELDRWPLVRAQQEEAFRLLLQSGSTMI